MSAKEAGDDSDDLVGNTLAPPLPPGAYFQLPPPQPYYLAAPPPPMPGYYHQGPQPPLPFMPLPLGGAPGMQQAAGVDVHAAGMQYPLLPLPPGLQQQQQPQQQQQQPHPSWAARFSNRQPEEQEQQQQEQQPHPSWALRYGHGRQEQQQQQLPAPMPWQQPAAAGAEDGQHQVADAQQEQQQQQQQQQQVTPGMSRQGLRLRLKVPRRAHMSAAAAAAAGCAAGQPGLLLQRQEYQEEHEALASVLAAQQQQHQQREVTHHSLQGAGAKPWHQQQRAVMHHSPRAAGAKPRQTQAPGIAGGQEAAPAAAADRPLGVQSVRLTRRVTQTQVDIFLGTDDRQQQQVQVQVQRAEQRQRRRPAGWSVGRRRTRQLIADNTGGQAPAETPEAFFSRQAADASPFWASEVDSHAAGVLGTAALLPPAGFAPGALVPAVCELSVVLTSQQVLQLRRGAAAVQLWCFKVGDEVPCRVHWPATNQQVQVNGTIVYPVMAKRLKLGQLQPHQGDLPVDCTKHVIANANLPDNRLSGQARLSVRLSAQVMVVPQHLGSGGGQQQPGSDYVLGARLVRARSIQEVKALLARPPSLQDAVRELQDKLAGDDDDVVAAATTVSTRCAASMVPMQTPANFGTGEGLVCFDLDNFLEMAQRAGKFQCPGTRRFHTWRELQTSPWMAAVLQSLEAAGLKDSVTHIEVSPDAKWRPQGGARSCWFDVLQPPTAAQLRASLQQGAARAGGARSGDNPDGTALSDSDEGEGRAAAAAEAAATAAGGRAPKRQRREPQKKEVIVIGSDSEGEHDDSAAPVGQAPAAAAAAGRGQPVRRPALWASPAAEQGGSRGAAAAAAAAAQDGNRTHQQQQQQQQQPAHRQHPQQQPLVSRAAWLSNAEMLRRAQEQQQMRLVRQRSGIGQVGEAPGGFTAMLMEGRPSSEENQRPRHHHQQQQHVEEQQQQDEDGQEEQQDRQEGQEAAGSAGSEGWSPGSFRESDLDDEVDEELDDYISTFWRSASKTPLSRMPPAVAAAAAGPEELRELHNLWRGGGGWRAAPQQQQQRQQALPPPAPVAPARQEVEVIDLLSDSD